MEINPLLAKKFFQDPDWPGVEAVLMHYVNQIDSLSDIDRNQLPEAVHAEVVGRQVAKEKIIEFLREVKAIGVHTPTRTVTFK